MSYLQGPFSYQRFYNTAVVLFTICVCFVFGLSANAQDDLNVHGVVSNAMTSSKLADVKVTVLKNGSSHNTFTTRANGKYEFYLDCNASYELVFEKSGYVKRSLLIDARNVPEEIVGPGIIMPTDMSMYEITEAMKNEDLSVFNQPIGKASYNAAEGDLVWDFSYTNKVKTEINNFMRDIEKRQKELDKENAAAEKAAAQQEAKFNQFVKDGDAAVKRTKYEDAIINYNAALGIKPDAADVKAKRDEAQAKHDAIKAQEQLDASYSAALDAGDSFMRAEEFQKAIDKYNEALKLKPNEKYPKDQIASATKTLEEKLANRKKQDEFNDLMTEGENLVSDKKYEPALQKYQAAQKIFPDNKEVAKRIAAVNQTIADREAQAAKQKQYDDLIAAADKKFKAEDYEAALKDYQSAGAVLPDETYPKERIQATQEKITAIANAAKQKQDFDKLVSDGDKALAASNHQLAIDKYQEALTIFSDDQKVKAKLEDVKGILAEKEAAAKKRLQYESLIQEADGLYNKDELAAAKSKYQEARNLFSEENYPLDQIAKIDKKLKDLADSQQAQEQYDAAMAAGKSALNNQNFNDAIAQFETALEIFKGDKEATSALENAKTLLKEQTALLEKQQAYESKIASADTKMAQEQYEQARKEYQEAQKIKPDENYPQSQIDLIDATLAQNAEEAAKLKQVNTLVAEGDALVEKKSFESAIVKYNEALALLPSRSDIQPKIDNAMSKMLAFEEAAGIDASYAAAVQQADKAFDKEDWAQAKSMYEEALKIKAEESHPKNRLKAIEQKIAESEAAARLADAQREKAQFDEHIAKGDKSFNQKNFSEAIAHYENALAINPSSEKVHEKIAEANQALNALDAKREKDNEFDRFIKHADELFAEKSYEMAKLKYTDALELKPDAKHPASRISEIDILLEKDRLAALVNEAEALQKQYNEAVKLGDNHVVKENYDDAIAAYQAALELKPDENYPKRQIERAQHLKDAKEEAALAAKARAEATQSTSEKKSKRPEELSRVNTSSEDQAEQFMRDAREAQESEKHERIKQLKEQEAQNVEMRELSSADRRQDEANRIQELKNQSNSQFAEAEAASNERIKNSENYKNAIYQSEEIRSQTQSVLIRENFATIKSDAENRKEWFNEREQRHEKEIERQVNFKNEQLELMREWTFADEEKRASMNAQIQEMAALRYSENKRAEEIRNENTAQLQKIIDDVYEQRIQLNAEELERLKKWAAETAEFETNLAAVQSSKGDAKVKSGVKSINTEKQNYENALKEAELMADKRRAESAEELKNLRSHAPKEYDEYFRSYLAENYPAGVSEESSTLGNKVIITRIVVKGNKGDEYKKVLDIAGNYYFKNGQSISETTWNRETINAYHKKD